ncbi:MAG: alpha/beta fold hydrolase [Thermodesulfobacteriota bacterium]
MASNDVVIPCGTLILEGIVQTPDHEKGMSGGALICHPHPLYGGNMHNNVTRALSDALVQRGLVSLRFNFRGTGKSQGRHGEGLDEIQDVKAALDFLLQQRNVDPARIVLAGYSFGCWVGFRAASEDPRPTHLIGISPPLDAYDFAFLRAEKRPKLLVAGDRDFICPVDQFKALVDEVPEPKKGVTIEGDDHFHIGREKYLVGAADEFLDEFP